MPEPDLRQAIAAAIRDQVRVHLGPNALGMAMRGQPVMLNYGEAEDAADAALAAIQGAYTPPPPGSDRDALPPHIRAAIAPHMPPYISTYEHTADACHAAAVEHPELAAELHEWADRMRDSCRQSRKQDLAPCQHPEHRDRPGQTGEPTNPQTPDAEKPSD